MKITGNIHQQQNIKLNSDLKILKQQSAGYNHSNISFGSSKSEGTLKLLERQIDKLIDGNCFDVFTKMKFAKSLKKALPEIMTPENYINRGTESKIYRISDKYVARIKRKHYQNNAINFYNTVSVPNRKFKDIDIYYGEPVAKMGYVEILKNATPKSDAIYCGVKFNGNKAPSAAELKRYEEEYLPLCSSLPQESFDELAFSLKKLNEKSTFGIYKDTLFDETGKEKIVHRIGKRYYAADFNNPNNWIISDGKIKLVDKFDKVDVPEPNSFYKMIEPLILRLMPFEDEHNFAKYNPKLVEMRATIFNKCLRAAKKADLPVESGLEMENVDWYLSRILPKN